MGRSEAQSGLRATYHTFYNERALEPMVWLSFGSETFVLTPKTMNDAMDDAQFGYDKDIDIESLIQFLLGLDTKPTPLTRIHAEGSSPQAVRAIYVPPNMEIVLSGSISQVGTDPYSATPSKTYTGPRLVMATTIVNGGEMWGDGVNRGLAELDVSTINPVTPGYIYTSHFTKIKISRKAIVKGGPTLWSDIALDLARGKYEFVVAGRPVSGLKPHSIQMDSFMTAHCSQNKYKNDKICACFLKQVKNISGKGPFLPVACSDQDCYHSGYQTRQMRDEECSYTLCDQFINQNGDKLKTTGDSKIYCSGRYYNVNDPNAPNGSTVNSTPIPVADNKTAQSNGSTSTPITTWIVLALAVVVFCVLLFFVVQSDARKQRST